MYNNNAFLCKYIDTPYERNYPMIPLQEILVAAAVVLAIAALARSSLGRHREYKNRDSARKLELVLQPRETIKSSAPRKGAE